MAYDKKIKILKKYLKRFGYEKEYDKIKYIIKICSMPGIDYPTEETEIEGIDNILEHLKEDSGRFIYLDNPKGTKKRFGGKVKRKMPFHYGEFTELNNPADDMGWDIIVVPSYPLEPQELEAEEGDPPATSEGTADRFQFEKLKKDLAKQEAHPTAYISAGHNLVPVGYVPVNDDQEEWTEKTKSSSRPNGKPAPIGNDKIILAPDDGWDDMDEDKRKIEEFFESLWTFKDVVWL